MVYSSKIKKGEILIYILIWILVLLMPVFIFRSSEGNDWNKISREWIQILPFFLVFLIHNFLLFPTFFVSKKNLIYFSTTSILILGVSLLMMVIGKDLHPVQHVLPMKGQPPGIPGFEIQRAVRPKPWQMLLFENVLFSVLVVGFNAAIKLTIKWQEEEQKYKDLEKEKLQTELAFLKNQVSPHFFMNTLNNIHALIDINSEDAKKSIIKLSKLMRYLLYDSEQGKTTLGKEIEFIKSYVELMKMRFTSDVKIKLSFPEIIPEAEIPPMLFISMVENAFKHGISYQTESFVGIFMRIHKEHLFFRIENSRHQNNSSEQVKGGLGLANLKKRLELLYSSDFELNSSENENTFEINVKIPIHGN